MLNDFSRDLFFLNSFPRLPAGRDWIGDRLEIGELNVSDIGRE